MQLMARLRNGHEFHYWAEGSMCSGNKPACNLRVRLLFFVLNKNRSDGTPGMKNKNDAIS